MTDWLVAIGSLVAVLVFYEALRAAAKFFWHKIRRHRRRKRGIYYEP